MASRLLRRQVMTLTDAAAARVRELTEAAGKPVAGLTRGREERRLRRHVLYDGARRSGESDR